MTQLIQQTIESTELAHAEQRIERTMRHAWLETSIEYERIRESRLYKQAGWNTWSDYCQNRWTRTYQAIDTQILAAHRVREMTKIFVISEDDLPASVSHVTALAKLEEPEEQAQVWQRVLASANGKGITAKDVSAEVERYKAEKEKNWYTLTEWNALSSGEQSRLLTQTYGHKKTFNETNDNVEWALRTWNPVTGCLHNCPYCYARDIADRFYAQKFEPSFIPERLSMPANTVQPDLSRENDPVRRLGLKNVFTCSMADLFGKWVPNEWIEAVLQQAWDNPQWNFLFLTKFPIRMADFEYPDNAWIGTTVDKQAAVERAEKAFTKVRAGGYGGVAWLSCEPMMERLTFSRLDMFDWVVMGGSSRSTQTPEFKPPFDWTNHLYNQSKAFDLPVYMKTNLGIDNEIRVREYPVSLD